LPMAASDELVAQAQARLEKNRTAPSAATIKRLKDTHKLSDEVELALRMLSTYSLAEVASRLTKPKVRLQMSKLPDRSPAVMAIISEIDPDVEALVGGLMELDASAEAEDAAAGGEEAVASAEVVERAQQRLQTRKAELGPLKFAIQHLKTECGLSDEVELALRMLSPDSLKEVLAGRAEIKSKCIEKQDGGRFLLAVISQLDPEIEALMSALLELDAAGAEEEEEATAGEAEIAPEDEEVVRRAKARLAAPKSERDRAAIKRLKASCGFGDEVELALQMLPSHHLREIVAGEAELVEKVQQAEDIGSFMLWLISQLDGEVETLVNKLLEIEGRGAAEGSEEADPGSTTPELLAEAQRRLQAHRTPENDRLIKGFQQFLNLGDEVELALRMLAPAKLAKILVRKVSLRQELVAVEDKSQHILSIISKLDPDAEALVSHFMQADALAEDEGPSRSRSPRRAPMPSPASRVAAVAARVAAVATRGPAGSLPAGRGKGAGKVSFGKGATLKGFGGRARG